MEFSHPDGRTIPVFLPARSVLVMTGESRYVWTHSIPARKSDVLPVSVVSNLAKGGNDIGADMEFGRAGCHQVAEIPEREATEDRLTLLKRGTRTSFTFRKTLADPDNYGQFKTAFGVLC